ncbi:hypothetical protein DTO166G4_5331 [Paecilomyces variotii]|nr:hypothetical protein DTO166G4_5331 [Paecilomyces variotii]KAJ9234236.1 hypothetical protein DTO166G5_5297 [Paecilomyces variotii]KAJ9362593.1 hypothetical protein DTO027B9_270 [Paecilomyces variotii]KAJ9363848.1 hypothetical protein DTO280E4_2070 [Paecilomyces variotii]
MPCQRLHPATPPSDSPSHLSRDIASLKETCFFRCVSIIQAPVSFSRMRQRLYPTVKAAGRSTAKIREGSAKAIQAGVLDSDGNKSTNNEDGKLLERDVLAISTRFPCHPVSRLLEDSFYLPPVQRDATMLSHRRCLEDSIGYQFKDLDILKEGFVAAGASSAVKDTHVSLEGNKRLAFVGDAVLRLIVADEWFPSGTSTATANKLLEEYGSNDKLSETAKARRFQDYLIRNPSQRGEDARTTLASTTEALIGAVWIDSGKDFVTTQRVVKKLGLFPKRMTR